MSEHDEVEALRGLIVDFLKDAVYCADSEYWHFLDKWRKRFEGKAIKHSNGWYPEYEEES